MASSSPLHAGDPDRPAEDTPRETTRVVEGERAGELLALLEDDYSRRLLAALDGESRPARELVAACEASRATVYRRLDRLEEFGLVATGTELHRDGHHRRVYDAVFRGATVELAGDSLQVRLVVAAPADRSSPRLPTD